MSWDDPDAVVRELNSLAPKVEEQPSLDSARLEAWLRTLVERRGADLLLVAGSPPCVRVDGRIVRTEEPPLEGDEIEAAVYSALPAYARRRYDETKIADAPDFPTALRAVVRQSPDVIVIGEMRDPDTMRIALAAARLAP